MARTLRTPGAASTLMAALVCSAALCSGSLHARVTRIVIDSVTRGHRARSPTRRCADAHSANSTRPTRRTPSSPTSSSARTPTARSATRPRSRSPSRSTCARPAASSGTTCRTAAATIIIPAVERELGDIGLAQRLAGRQRRRDAIPAAHTTGTNHWVQVPMAREVNGQLVTGNVLARIVNRSGVDVAAAERDGQPGAVPAGVAEHRRRGADDAHARRPSNGQVTVGSVIPSSDWAFARCTRRQSRSPARRSTTTSRTCRTTCRSTSA